jgi:hypothetical protein
MESTRISPEMAVACIVDGNLDMGIPEGCTEEYLNSFSVGFQERSMFELILAGLGRQGYDDGKVARKAVNEYLLQKEVV